MLDSLCREQSRCPFAPSSPKKKPSPGHRLSARKSASPFRANDVGKWGLITSFMHGTERTSRRAADKTVIPVCYGNLSKDALPHPYSGIQALNLPSEAYYLMKGVNHQLNLDKPMSPDAVYRGTLFERGAGIKDGAYERLANALAEFKDD